MNPPFKKYDDLNPLYPSVLCAKHVCNWSSDSREDFKKMSIYFYCILVSPLCEGYGSSFEQT